MGLGMGSINGMIQLWLQAACRDMLLSGLAFNIFSCIVWVCKNSFMM